MFRTSECQQVTNPSPGRPLPAREAARLLGVSRDTLRHYEGCGLLKTSRSPAGYRLYSQKNVDRLRLIRGALGLGFTVEELQRILQHRDSGGAPCHEVARIAAEKLQDLNTRIAELTALRKRLRRTLEQWQARVNGADEHTPLRLLESFVASFPESVRELSPQVSPGLARKFHKHEVKEDDDDSGSTYASKRRSGASAK